MPSAGRPRRSRDRPSPGATGRVRRGGADRAARRPHGIRGRAPRAARRRTIRAVRPRPDRLTRLPQQYFVTLLARVAAAALEGGEALVDLGRGNPDVGPPRHVIERLADAARDPDAHGYAPIRGIPELREAIAARYRDFYGIELDP